MARAPKGWHKADIKAALEIKGWTLTGLALANNLHPDACIDAFRRPNFDGEMAIAEVLRLSPRQLWPQRYDGITGDYLHPKSRDHHNARRAERNVQCGEAA